MVFAINPRNLIDRFILNAISHASSTVVIIETKTVTSILSPSASALASIIIKPIWAQSTRDIKAPTNSVSSTPSFRSGVNRSKSLLGSLLYPLLATAAFMWLL